MGGAFFGSNPLERGPVCRRVYAGTWASSGTLQMICTQHKGLGGELMRARCVAAHGGRG